MNTNTNTNTSYFTEEVEANYKKPKNDIIYEELILIMKANIHEPLTICELSEVLKVPKKSIERIFKDKLYTSPAKYYLQLRLEAARNKLMETDLYIADIAVTFGFKSHSHFTRSYKNNFGYLPTQHRQAVKQYT